MPTGLLVTVPAPAPLSAMFSPTVPLADNVKVAVTDCALLRLTVQAPVPEHAPDHPENVLPDAGVAVSITVVPLLKLALQVCPQLIPAGELVTVPVPDPARATLSCACPCGFELEETALHPQNESSPTTHRHA
jgi:hypothetical protein